MKTDYMTAEEVIEVLSHYDPEALILFKTQDNKLLPIQDISPTKVLEDENGFYENFGGTPSLVLE